MLREASLQPSMKKSDGRQSEACPLHVVTIKGQAFSGCCRTNSLSSSRRTPGPITTNLSCEWDCCPSFTQHRHWWLWVPDRVRCAHLSGTTWIGYPSSRFNFKQPRYKDRHCERSEAIHSRKIGDNGLL